MEAPNIVSVLRSLDTSNIMNEFKKINLEESEEGDISDSEDGDTTSGSESNFDDKELNKILPKSFKQRKLKSKRTN